MRVVVTAGWSLFVPLLGVLAGCPPPLERLAITPGCNPILSGVECGLPYPSDFFLVDDATLPSHAALLGAYLVHASGGTARMAPVENALQLPASPTLPAQVLADLDERVRPGRRRCRLLDHRSGLRPNRSDAHAACGTRRSSSRA